MTCIGVNGHTECGLSIKKIRKQGLKNIEEKHKKKLLRLFGQIVLKAAHEFVPMHLSCL